MGGVDEAPSRRDRADRAIGEQRVCEIAAAVLEPEIAPKAAPVIAVATPRPPGNLPVQHAIDEKSVFEMPLAIMNSAMSRNMGMVRNS